MAIGCGCQHPVFSINIFGVTGVIASFFKTGFRDILSQSTLYLPENNIVPNPSHFLLWQPSGISQEI
jgi:hypothetical protein